MAITIFSLIVLIVILLFSVIIHEVAHGSVALYLGDPTAKNAGRLTLNPLKHLDPIGSVVVPLFLVLMAKVTTGGGIIFGWAKPVPINPYNFRDQKYGQAKVAIAGPSANLLLALIFGLSLRFISFEGVFFQNLVTVFSFVVWINLLLGIFNLLPIPPLDGSHILFTFLPYSARNIKMFLSRYGIILLVLFIFFFLPLLIPVINFVFTSITGFSFI